ncbi:hypothetical protein BDQ12DRAFT_661782 [Crucibulum laeve]|uniref:Uncharacterized protein n=1 Tax=Crucibulum laeve TaxID=68775 RepID=A0A5C3MCA1_9AGAR|nr:hypothetical protein BDQ12DRAFT_661782 [Crucibulum laeve]
MSISVDDLVSSLSSSHIGQEALDLATLQAQLAQTLFGQTIASSSSTNPRQVPRGPSHTQPCNTPTGRTPSSSFSSWGQMMPAAASISSSSSSSWRGADEFPSRNAGDDMEEDERMVEELLMPSSPMSNATPSNFLFSQQIPPSPISPLTSYPYPSSSSVAPSAYSAESSQSLFTTTDPFYMAQLQASQNYSSPQSVFSQTGRPTQTSPFMKQQAAASTQSYPISHRDNHGYMHSNAPPLSLDTHAMFARTGAAF